MDLDQACLAAGSAASAYVLLMPPDLQASGRPAGALKLPNLTSFDFSITLHTNIPTYILRLIHKNMSDALRAVNACVKAMV